MASTSSPVAPPLKPTGARHRVLVFAATLSVITYIDRVCISQAAGPIQLDLKLDDVQMGYVFAAFLWAYALFEIPGGWMGDKIGPRRVLMRVVVMWSFFTAATGWVRGLWTLLTARFLFGAGEAGCFPNLAKAFTNWLPASERRRAASVMWVSSRWGGAVTPLLVVWLIRTAGWRWSFQIFAVIGVVWAVIFYIWFRDNPRDHPGVNAAELELLKETQVSASASHAGVPWAALMKSRTVWLLMVQYFCFGYGWYFYITWLPKYLQEGRGLELEKGAILAGIPLFFGGFACIISTALANWLVRKGYGLARIRRWIAIGGFMGAAVLLVLSFKTADPVRAMLVMGMASFSLDLALIIVWDTCMSVGGRYTGTVSGGVNMAGQLGGMLMPIVIGYVLKHLNNNWTVVFYLSAIIYFVGGLCWLWIDPVTPLDGDDTRGGEPDVPLAPAATS